MKKIYASLLLIILFFSSCVTLQPTAITRYSSLDEYKYFYIPPTSEKTSVYGGVYGNQYGVYGSNKSISINPNDVISGYFIKRGYIKLLDINPELLDKTFIVNYGETKNEYNGFSYVEGVIIQIISAKDNGIICVCTSEADGDKEVTALSRAINACMEEIFKK